MASKSQLPYQILLNGSTLFLRYDTLRARGSSTPLTVGLLLFRSLKSLLPSEILWDQSLESCSNIQHVYAGCNNLTQRSINILTSSATLLSLKSDLAASKTDLSRTYWVPVLRLRKQKLGQGISPILLDIASSY